MGYVIAVAGKGGTGKTTVSALIVRLLKEKKCGSILAVDADPNSNLAEALGVTAKETIGSILDRLSANPQEVPPGMGKDSYVEYRVQTAIVEGDGFDLLAMGHPEGAGCYCYVNNVLRNVISKLVKDYDFIVLDNEAGLEHLSRRTTRNADALLIVSDASSVGLKAAQRINQLVKELDIRVKNKFLIVNRSSGGPDKEKVLGTGLEYLGHLPLDGQISEFSLKGAALMDLDDNNACLNALKKIGEKIWHKS
ncbi:MAG: AAA family ATPase [Candidatus Omnitrophica bacterium]|nr:AAA family ATPase [Candidatus Omnitrophota bacterium]MDD5512753.1 AAA family ATPase [Candidatus Omnitrophota bacterium]